MLLTITFEGKCHNLVNKTSIHFLRKADNSVCVIMIPTIIISVITFISITASILFFPTIKIGKVKIGTYWIIAVIGASLLLAFSFAPIKDVWEQMTNSTTVNPIKILVLFFSMTVLSIFLDEVGLFKFLANIAAKSSLSPLYR